MAQKKNKNGNVVKFFDNENKSNFLEAGLLDFKTIANFDAADPRD